MNEIYLNHAGTSWPKPEAVRRAMQESWFESSTEARALLDHRHAALAEGLEVRKEDLLITPGCTQALHLALEHFAWSSGDELVIGAFEHLAVEGPARGLAARGVHTWVAPPGPEGAPVDLAALDARLRSGKVRLVAMSGASNVTGALYPVAELRERVRRHGAHLLIDAAQTVGWLPLPEADLVAFGSHKGLQGPWGLGGLVISPSVPMATPRAEAPLSRPSWCDAGSVDRCALAGVAAGIETLARSPHRLDRARSQVARLRVALEEVSGARILGPTDEGARVPTVAAALPELRIFAERLEVQGVIGSVGEQCAPLAHATLGTAGEGALRLSVGPETSEEEIARAVVALRGAGGVGSLGAGADSAGG